MTGESKNSDVSGILLQRVGKSDTSPKTAPLGADGGYAQAYLRETEPRKIRSYARSYALFFSAEHMTRCDDSRTAISDAQRGNWSEPKEPTRCVGILSRSQFA